MRRETIRAATLVAALLAGCHPAPQAASGLATACRVGPDGGPALADRGIGGTGAPVLADRGIGGTGIVGVITGFASICLAGQEVALPPDIPVLVNAKAVDPSALRVGQVAVIEAGQGKDRLSARRVDIRYEVIGQVTGLDGDHLDVAGQAVILSPSTWGERPRVGDWVAVSGLRRPDGTVEATRFDASAAGPVLIHGVLAADGAALDFHVAGLPVGHTLQMATLIGQPVTVSGVVVHGALVPLTVEPDLLVADPGTFFGPAVGTVFVEGFASVDRGRLRLGPAFSAPAPGWAGSGGRGVFRFERAGPELRAVPVAGAPVESQRRFEPAPLPNRAIRAPGGVATSGARHGGPESSRPGRLRRGSQGGDPGVGQGPGFGGPVPDGPHGRP